MIEKKDNPGLRLLLYTPGSFNPYRFFRYPRLLRASVETDHF